MGNQDSDVYENKKPSHKQTQHVADNFEVLFNLNGKMQSCNDSFCFLILALKLIFPPKTVKSLFREI